MSSQSNWDRIVAHADMDAFYAAVEQLDDPSLRGLPILVGAQSGRGVVLTASYEARPFKVGSAMPMAQATRLCPQALIVPPRFDRYKEISVEIMKVFADFSPVVEPLSLDEAFLDMTGAANIFGSPRSMGRKLKDAVREVTGGLTVSVGLSATKYVAKVASAYAKPDGLTVVEPDGAVAWLAPQSVARLWGAGSKTQAKMRELGYEVIADVAAADKETLVAQLGRAGGHFFELAHAHDSRPVLSDRGAQSICFERTLHYDVSGVSDIRIHLRNAADKIGQRLRRKDLVAGGVRVKLKTNKFQLLSRQCVLSEPTDLANTLYVAGKVLLPEFDNPGPFRLIGMAAFQLSDRQNPQQMSLLRGNDHHRSLEAALDEIGKRFGDDVMHRANDLPRPSEPRLSSDIDFLDGAEPDLG